MKTEVNAIPRGSHRLDNSIEVDPLDKIKQEERLSILADELIKMKSKRKIIEEYSQKWDCAPATIRALINETIVWLSTTVKISREEMRALNSERLDDLFEDATIKEKLRIIDLLNKTHNVYTQVVDVQSDKEIFKIDIGV